MPYDQRLDPQLMADKADAAARFYRQFPACSGADSVIDLYCAVALLATVVEKQRQQLAVLMPDKSDDV